MQTNPWEIDWSQPQAAPPVAGQPVTVGTRRPPEPPKPNLPTGYEIGPNGVARPIPGVPVEPPKGGDPEVIRRRKADAAANVLFAIGRARKGAGGWTTGLVGQVLGNVGGTDAKTLAGDLDTIKANLAFDQLQAMREASPTGGAVGNVTEMELRLLGSTVASLDQAQDAKDLKERLEIVEKTYSDILGRMGYNVKPLGAAPGDVQFKDEQKGIVGKRLSSSEQAEFETLLKTPGITGASINNWLVSHGLGPDPKIDEKVEQARKMGGFSTGVDYSKVDEAVRAEAEAALEARGGPDPAAETLITTGMTLGLRDEAQGVGGGLSSLIQGRNPIEGYVRERNAGRLEQEQARDATGWGGTGLEIVGGLLSANPNAAIAPITTRLGTIGQGAKQGAIGGALAGYGYGEGLEGSATNALLGGVAGGVVGGGLSAYASRNRGGADIAQQEAADLAEAAARQGVPINVANARPGARNALAYLESSPGSAGPVQRNIGEQVSALESKVGGLGGGGTSLSNLAAGTTIRGASERFITRTKAIKDRLYSRATQAAGDAKVEATNAITAIKAKIAQLSETPTTNQARISALEDILTDIASPDGSPKPISVQGMRELRTGVRASLKQKGLTMTPAEADTAEALRFISQDIMGTLQQSNPQAARLFARADGFYQQRQQVINDVLKRVIGTKDKPLSGEDVWRNVQAMAQPKGDEVRLATLMKTLEPEERLDLASTIVENLGRAKPGEDFSAAYFVNQAGNLSKRARVLFFGRDGAEAIDDLVRIARSTRDVQRSLNNSRSGQVMNYRQTAINSISTLLGTGGGAAAGGVPGAIVGAALARGTEMGTRRVSAAVLLSPRFTRWLSRAPRNATPDQIQAHIRRLGSIGRDTPLAADMQTIQQALQRQFAPAAASNNDQEERP